MRRLGMAVGVVLLTTLARAEGVGPQKASTAGRLNGATTIAALPGGLLSIGGSRLRRLAPGSSRWETLHTQSGDDLYRVAGDDSGRVLAGWENDRFIRLFTPGKKEHVALPKPVSAAANVSMFSLDGLAISQNSRDALVFMKGSRRGVRCSTWTHAAFRVALDGKSEAKLLFEVGNGYLLRSSRHGAVYVVRQESDRGCSDAIASIVAFEVSDEGVKRTTLLGGEHAAVEKVRVVRGTDDERLALMLELKARGRALLVWRRGQAKAEHYPLPALTPPTEPTGFAALTKEGELIELTIQGEDFLEVRRRRMDGGAEQVVTLPALQLIDSGVHGLGIRSNGDLWAHWGDHLALLSPGKPPRSFNLEPLLARREEWAGADIYVPTPESLWVGIDTRGRNFVQLSFSEVEKRAKAWAQR